VLLNLYLNAVEAMDPGGKLSVSLSMDEGSAWIKIMVSDTGSGISKEDLEHIFDPYFTTKQTAQGWVWPSCTRSLKPRRGSEGGKRSGPRDHGHRVVAFGRELDHERQKYHSCG